MKSNDPLVSVIIASYNHQEFVKEAVVSVLNQSYANIQVIAVDDGSIDKSVQILRKIKDQRLKVISLKNNRQYHVRNLALKKAQGDFIAFQNSDDIWHKDKLMKQMAYIRKHKEVGAIFTEVEFINDKSNISEADWANGLLGIVNRKRIDWLKYFLENGNCLSISSSLVRRKIIDQVGVFNESLVQLSDFDLWIRVAAVSELYILNEKLTQIRVLKDRNLSAPTPETINRSTLEFAQVFHRYAEPLISRQLGTILPGKLRNKIQFEVLQQGRLIQKCWEVNTPAHILFAIQLADHLLENPSHRKILTLFLGISFIQNHFYIKSKLQLILT
jgi:glycosyltransferase involved in cell wall biosynthesis